MKKHSPGPWTVRYGDVSDADEGFGIVSELEPGIVAECWPCTTDLAKRQQLRANARLIAAAPELCQLLRDIVHGGDADGFHATNWRSLYRHARNVIARIDGQ